MGVSGRATHKIEPKAGDLLMPDRIRRASSPRMRDVEDACFETVGGPRDVASARASAADSRGVFKSRLTQAPDHGPFPRDYPRSGFASGKSTEPGERLGVFNEGGSIFATGKLGLSIVGPAFVVVLCTVTAAVFWMAGGHTLLERPAVRMQTSAEPTPVAPEMSINTKTRLLPNPVVTSSIPEKATDVSKGGYTAPLPRPARIERAGSILMIRPSGG